MSLVFSDDNSTSDVDRSKVRIDDPDVTGSEFWSANIGDTDITIEMWLHCTGSENSHGNIDTGNNYDWIQGSIFFDRDRREQGNAFGASLSNENDATRSIAFGFVNTSSNIRTVVGSINVADSQWHHIAIQRRFSDTVFTIHVDGILDAAFSGAGADGDISYPSGGIPSQTNCGGGPCDFSDPFIVFGKEKHNAQDTPYSGAISEVRLSDTLRYPMADNFTVPTQRYTTDANTRGLWHLTDGSGLTASDSSEHQSGSTEMTLHTSSTTGYPLWSPDEPNLVAVATSQINFGGGDQTRTISIGGGSGNTVIS